MTGPRLKLVADVDWAQHLKDQHIEAWYCSIPGAAPGGYSTQDGVGGASDGDLVVTTVGTYRAARRAMIAITGGVRPQPHDVQALLLILHELSHCLVRLDAKGQCLPEDLVKYSHPGEPWPAIKHALAPPCTLGINAFTRLLRFRHSPDESWHGGLAWFDGAVRLQEA